MRLIYTVFILLLVLMTSAQCQQTTKSIEIFNNWNIGGVDNSPSCNPSFTISQAHYITYIDTYHWNSGSGTAAGGTIGLRSDVGTEYGPWQTETTPGQGGVPNANWIAHPNETIPAGTYTIIDSESSSWSQNSESNGCGFSKVEGYPSQETGQSNLTGSWKMAGYQTGLNAWEAALALNSDGTLGWTETKGANVGGTRTGTWQFDGTTFTMTWISPDGGKTNWISRSVTVNYMGEGTYTVEKAPGGTWTATRATSTPQVPPCGEGAIDL